MEANGHSLQDKVAVVTGGGQSLGLEIGRALKAAGAKVVVGEINAETGEQAAEELGGDFVQLDVTDPESVKNMVSTVLDRLHRRSRQQRWRRPQYSFRRSA